MRAAFEQRIRAARRLAGLALVAAAGLTAAASPAVGGATAGQAQAGGGKTIVLRYYSVTASFVYRHADGTVVAQPPQTPAAGDQFEITELAYKGTHASHARRWSASSHTTCTFKSATGAPTCDGEAAVGGNQLLLFHTEPGSSPVVSGGTGRYAGATGGVTMHEVGDTNNSDIVITVHLRN